MFIFKTQLRFVMYQKLEFMKEVSIQHPIAAYKLHIMYFATDLTWLSKGRERVTEFFLRWNRNSAAGETIVNLSFTDHCSNSDCRAVILCGWLGSTHQLTN